MKIFLSILIYLLCTSCSTTKTLLRKEVTGKYYWSSIYGVHSTIQLNDDNTFEYKWTTGLISGTTIGDWNIDGKKMELNSSIQPIDDEQNNFDLIKGFSNSDSLSLKIVDIDNQPIPFVHCIFKKDTSRLSGATTDFHGETKVLKLKADSLLIIPPGNFKTIQIKYEPLVSEYKIQLEEINEFYKYFTKEVWKIKNNRLYDSSIKKDKYTKKKYYEKAN